MTEKELNHDIVSLFKEHGAFAYKIPDPPQQVAVSSAKRPFDGFARFPPPVCDIYFESKLIKNKVQAFNLSRIEPHQIDALLKIKRNGGTAIVTLGCWIPRKDYWFIAFDIDFIVGVKEISIKKKEILSLVDKGYCISLKAKDVSAFNPDWLKTKIVTSLGDE